MIQRGKKVSGQLSAADHNAQEAFRGSTPGAMDAQRLSLLLGERLRDVRYNENSDLIQRHGYLFEVLSTPTGQGLVRAWPVAHGDTGVTEFADTRDGPGHVRNLSGRLIDHELFRQHLHGLRQVKNVDFDL